jgi:hypothetical protein
MMYGRWKSDSAVVAEKSVNKAELSAAELMERRAGAKGNVDQQTTCRAQNRESVSQALERIRQAARHRKKERFTSLLHHVSVDLLRLAFFELKRNAAPGVDGLTWQGLRGRPRANRSRRLTKCAKDSGHYCRGRYIVFKVTLLDSFNFLDQVRLVAVVKKGQFLVAAWEGK